MKFRTETFRRACLGILLLASGAPAAAQAPAPATEYEGASALGLALRRLGTVKRVLMVGAHPDDESTQILSTLALGQGAEVAYLSLTRGEGGQNGIGPELQEGLGLLRSEELLAARRLDGARQYFTRAYDFGFSKDAEEAFRHWPRDSVLADVVAVIRHFRPDVVLSVFSGTPRDGHGQHQVAGILAREGFRAAGDPRRFADQLARGLRPHAPSRLYQASWWRDEEATERLSTGEVDPLLGRSHYQVAMASRSRHRSQDMGRELTPGPQSSGLRLLASQGGPSYGGMFAGGDTLLSARARRLAGSGANGGGAGTLPALLERFESRVVAARERFNPLAPGRIVPELEAALAALAEAERAAAGLGAAGAELRFLLEAERADAVAALWLAAGLVLDAVADDEAVVPGQPFALELSLWNGGSVPVAPARLEPRLPEGWRAEALDPLPTGVAPGELATRRFRVHVPADAPPTEPYFLRRARQGDLYRWPAAIGGVGVPFEPAPVVAEAAVTVGGARVEAEREATFRGVDKMQGELRRPLRVVEAVALAVEPALAVLPLGADRGDDALRFTVRLRAEATDGVTGALRVAVPAGWRVEPERLPLRFTSPGEERVVELSVHPPAGLRPGRVSLSAAFEADDGRRFTRGHTLVDYPHTRPRALYRPAEAAVQLLDVRVPPALRVGYVAGPGDEVPQALAQLGVRVEPLERDDLAAGDLGAYDVIVTGIRAYEVRPDLVTHNQRLLDYVRGGGTLIVQYNKYEFTEPGIAPYPVEMARPHDRVTDEAAPVRLLDPAHPVLAGPNRITAADFEGWVQERGLYFLRDWDERYTPLLEMADPGEPPRRGSLLVARHGEGTYVYTGLSFFRQLPAGVPGAYRLFANLLALGAAK